jgi:hypothetical protein
MSTTRDAAGIPAVNGGEEVKMKASPSTTDRSPGVMAAPAGGSAGSRRAVYRGDGEHGEVGGVGGRE